MQTQVILFDKTNPNKMEHEAEELGVFSQLQAALLVDKLKKRFARLGFTENSILIEAYSLDTWTADMVNKFYERKMKYSSLEERTRGSL